MNLNELKDNYERIETHIQALKESLERTIIQEREKMEKELIKPTFCCEPLYILYKDNGFLFDFGNGFRSRFTQDIYEYCPYCGTTLDYTPEIVFK